MSEIPPSGEVNAIGQDMNLAADEEDASLAKKNPIAQGSPKDWKKFSQYDPLPHDEVKRTLKELRISSKDLKSVVDDPLPSVLDLFNNVMKPHVAGQTSKTCSEGINHLSDKQGQIPPWIVVFQQSRDLQLLQTAMKIAKMKGLRLYLISLNKLLKLIRFLTFFFDL